MKTRISKILNRTDLAESGSHGGLVVTQQAKEMLRDFFEEMEVDCEFFDKEDEESFLIHYKDYTSNGTTPNDRVTPINRYASKHKLKPGDNLILHKIESLGTKKYFIEYVKKINCAYFIGKSKKTVEVLNYNQFTELMAKNIAVGKIRQISPNLWEMQVKYQGKIGGLRICQKADNYEMYFNGEHIEEYKKYFELNTTTEPFELRKTETWEIEIGIDSEKEELNDEADQCMVWKMAQCELSTDVDIYVPEPEAKKPGHDVGSRTVPDRSRDTIEKALARAGYLCEYDNSHKLFLRKNNL